MLLVVNAFLLILVLGREARSNQYDASARDEVVSVLAKSGIEISRAVLPKDSKLTAMTVQRDPAAEALAAAALVGEPVALDADSTTYTGPKGSVRFYADGEFSARLSPGAYPLGGQTPAAAAVACLSLIGFEGEVEAVSKHSVSVGLRWETVPVFLSVTTSARETVVRISDGELRSIEGYRLVGTPQPAPGNAPLDVVTILLRFLAEIKEGGDICSKITDMTPGYTLSTVQGGESRLLPTWHITTDTGSYYLNALTGAVLK